MSFGIVGEVLMTADMAASPPTFFHRFTVPKMMELKAVRTWIVKYLDPTFTALYMELRSGYNTGGARMLLARSTKSYSFADLDTANYSAKEIYFDWDNAPMLAPNVEYTLNLYASDYVGDETNHLAWARSWPDPIVPIIGAPDASQLGVYPFHVGLITRVVRR